MRKRRLALLLAIAALPVAAATVVVANSAPRGDPAELQRLVGGLGLGPAVDGSRCAAVFDPRVSLSCSLRHDPVPGASVFCPCHAAGSLFR